MKPDVEQFDAMLDAVREGTIDARMWDQLQTLIASDRELRRRYIQSVVLWGDLAERFGSGEGPSVEAPVVVEPGCPRFHAARWSIAAALLVIGAVAVVVAVVLIGNSSDTPDAKPGYGPALGVLVDAENLRWDSEPVWGGDEIDARPLRLTAGTATFDMFNGATVTIDGGTECVLMARDAAQLSRGSIAIKAPADIGGFTVHAPGVTIVDLGTAFRVNTNEQGRTTIRVTEGRVAVTHHATGRRVELVADQMVQVDQTAGLLGEPAGGAELFDNNLVVNGDFEEGPQVAFDSNEITDIVISGWVDTTSATVLEYGHGVSNGFPDPSRDVMPTSRGARYFVGAKPGTIHQDVDLTLITSLIDAGRVSADLSAWLGGFAGQDDAAAVTARFIDAEGNELSTATIGPVVASHRAAELGFDAHGAAATGFLFREATQAVPAKTRSVRIELTTTLDKGLADAYADNIALTLQLDRTPTTHDLPDTPQIPAR